jgi:hypothetical protein
MYGAPDIASNLWDKGGERWRVLLSIFHSSLKADEPTLIRHIIVVFKCLYFHVFILVNDITWLSEDRTEDSGR